MHGECITLLNVAQGVEGGGEDERTGGKESLREATANFSHFGWVHSPIIHKTQFFYFQVMFLR